MGALAHAFTAMMGQWEPRLTTLASDETPPVAVGFPASTDHDSAPPRIDPSCPTPHPENRLSLSDLEEKTLTTPLGVVK